MLVLVFPPLLLPLSVLLQLDSASYHEEATENLGIIDQTNSEVEQARALIAEGNLHAAIEILTSALEVCACVRVYEHAFMWYM